MKKTAFLLITFLLVIACANVGYEHQLQQYVGQTEQSLIENFGTPSVQKNLPNGGKILTYFRQGTYFVPVEYFYDTPMWDASDMVYDPFFNQYEMAPTSVVVDNEVEGVCQTSFVVENDIVKSYRFRGNACQ